MRKYKCYYCGAVFEKFRYKYDSSPRGDDEIVCPKCGHDDGFEEVIDYSEQYTWELWRKAIKDLYEKEKNNE